MIIFFKNTPNFSAIMDLFQKLANLGQKSIFWGI